MYTYVYVYMYIYIYIYIYTYWGGEGDVGQTGGPPGPESLFICSMISYVATLTLL